MEIPDETWAKIKLAIYEGKKIEAIKLYREATSLGLKESKEFIDKMESEMREKEPQRFTNAGSTGCFGMLVYVTIEATILATILHFAQNSV